MLTLLLTAMTCAGLLAQQDTPRIPQDYDEPSYCETYEEDCVRDNDDDGVPDNEEDDGGYS